jgi:hypothetical protein
MKINMTARIRAWKDKYKGERCFCVGNGPSLARTPLHLLNNEYTFGLNKIADIYPDTTWRPSFYVNIGKMVFNNNHTEAAIEAMRDTPSFISYEGMSCILRKMGGDMTVPDNVSLLRTSSANLGIRPHPDIWSHDITNGVSKYGSSMTTVAQIAVYLGFNPIYLLGCDMGYKAFEWGEKDPNHFGDDYDSSTQKDGRKAEMTEWFVSRGNERARWGHLVVKEVCDSLGVDVYNATLGGELEVYPRVDLMEVLNDIRS